MHRLGAVAHKSSTCLCTDGREESCRRLAASSGSARAPVLAGPASAPRASVRDTLVPSPAPGGRTDVRRCRAHVVRRREPGRESACALAGTEMIKVLANGTATRCRSLPNSMPLSVALGILVSAGDRTSISVRCEPTANRRLLKLNLVRLMRQAGKRCYRRRPRRR